MCHSVVVGRYLAMIAVKKTAVSGGVWLKDISAFCVRACARMRVRACVFMASCLAQLIYFPSSVKTNLI